MHAESTGNGGVDTNGFSRGFGNFRSSVPASKLDYAAQPIQTRDRTNSKASPIFTDTDQKTSQRISFIKGRRWTSHSQGPAITQALWICSASKCNSIGKQLRSFDPRSSLGYACRIFSKLGNQFI